VRNCVTYNVIETMTSFLSKNKAWQRLHVWWHHQLLL